MEPEGTWDLESDYLSSKPAPPRPCCMTLGRSLNLSVPGCIIYIMGDNEDTYLTEMINGTRKNWHIVKTPKTVATIVKVIIT